MRLDVDTFLVTVYCVIDDLYQGEVRGAQTGASGGGARDE